MIQIQKTTTMTFPGTALRAGKLAIRPRASSTKWASERCKVMPHVPTKPQLKNKNWMIKKSCSAIKFNFLLQWIQSTQSNMCSLPITCANVKPGPQSLLTIFIERHHQSIETKASPGKLLLRVIHLPENGLCLRQGQLSLLNCFPAQQNAHRPEGKIAHGPLDCFCCMLAQLLALLNHLSFWNHQASSSMGSMGSLGSWGSRQ